MEVVTDREAPKKSSANGCTSGTRMRFMSVTVEQVAQVEPGRGRIAGIRLWGYCGRRSGWSGFGVAHEAHEGGKTRRQRAPCRWRRYVDCTNPLRGNSVAATFLRTVPVGVRKARPACRSVKFSDTVARHEQHNFVWLPHSYRPQGLALAPTDDRRHDGAQLRTQHPGELPASGQSFRPTF